ncbi:MAG: hypothetical protein K2Y22_05045 [Candidatus Obscuribacterales bacterium]|nr:hypothetical protein [Candidatus Obscuribacterales bacterium]
MLPTVEFPQSAADLFLQKIREGNRKAAVEMFGDNTCHCPPRGGYETYLRYDMHDPTLAFLIGKPFAFTTGTVTPVNAEIPYVFPWDKPSTCYVDVELSFPNEKPYLLPMEMAFGIPMTEDQFNDFTVNPNKNGWKAFALRLRPSIAPGLIPTKPRQFKTQSKDQLENLLSPEMIPFLRATDAGDVILKDKSKMPLAEIEAKLPRLEKASLRLRVVKSGQLKPWKINKFRFEKASIIDSGTTPKESTIEFPLNSKFDL